MDRRERARGCLLGGALGDALGAPVEFLSLAQIQARCGRGGVTAMLPAYGRDGGAITDDTQMTLFAAEALIDPQGHPPGPTAVHAGFLRWYRTQTGPAPAPGSHPGLLGEAWLWSRRAPGNTCMSALARGDVGRDATNDSKGCGTVMRSAPFGFTPEPLEWAAASSQHTHGHPTATVAAAFFAELIATVLIGASLPDAVDATNARVVARFPDTHHETTNLVARAVHLATLGPPSPETIESLGGAWVADEALAIALLVALSATDWRDALTRAVSHGGDSDSTGSVAGNILGALWGDAHLPQDWVAVLEGHAIITDLAHGLASAL